MTTKVAVAHRLSLMREASHLQVSPRVPVVTVQLDTQSMKLGIQTLVQHF